jgi:F-box/leucine-rich repeat protein 10/11
LFGDLLPEDFEYDTVADDGQDKLDMVMPEDLTVRQVCNLAGPDTPLDVIDVKTQNSGAKWNLARWADYYEEAGDDKPIRNVISLEVSQTKLGRLLRRPKIVRDIDLQDEVWPQEEKDKGKWPKVQFYCLMSVADSYTDFHIDFGGSSVYYHILKGKKTFFFIPPKTKHLKAYEEWNDSPQQNYTFLPSITKECYRVDLHEGDTMLIPSGWIHAVWTPETSLVIGGNFLTRMSFQNQFKVVEIEKANETPMKFRYPYFQKLMWYTAIKYLKDDPLPAEVSQGFYDGKRFERDRPVWADFDGEMAASDDRAGLGNARYYSQAEVEGLPELANFIFRTVMLVMGRVEGISADRMKRVNSSIPKGHGEPLEIAKTFALWVAWKRGNEDPPAWAHPEAVLPNNSKDEGPPKKLSARALKEMERKEAIAAWRIAPDRQSERVRKAAAAASDAVPPGPKGASATTPDRATSFTPSRPSQQHSKQALPHQDMAVQAPPVAAPMALMMNGSPTHYLSTPKTSVLGPKRVACDACRKRRIRCKHKDLVLQATPDHLHAMHPSMPSGAPMHAFAGQESHDAVAASPPKTNHHFATDAQNATLANAIDGLGPLPGTNAYINANIPMTMNGVPIFGDSAKRGRTKACFECKKSKVSKFGLAIIHTSADTHISAAVSTMKMATWILSRPRKLLCLEARVEARNANLVEMAVLRRHSSRESPSRALSTRDLLPPRNHNHSRTRRLSRNVRSACLLTHHITKRTAAPVNSPHSSRPSTTITTRPHSIPTCSLTLSLPMTMPLGATAIRTLHLKGLRHTRCHLSSKSPMKCSI